MHVRRLDRLLEYLSLTCDRHCGEDEDHDPAPDWEEPLECSICRAFSHLKCDRTANEEGAVKSAYDEGMPPPPQSCVCII